MKDAAAPIATQFTIALTALVYFCVQGRPAI